MDTLTKQDLWRSVAVHAACLALLVFSVRFESRVIRANPVDITPVMHASVVSEALPASLPRLPPPPPPPAPQKPKPVPKVKETPPTPPVEDKKAVSLASKKTPKPPEPKPKTEEPKKVPEKPVVDKQKQEALKKAQEQAAKQEAQKKAQLAEQKRQKNLQQEAEKILQAQIEAEQAEQQLMDEMAKYHQIIIAHIQSYWRMDTMNSAGLSCLIYVKVLASGQVAQASIARSSGNAAFDHSATMAVMRASPLPLPNEARAREQFLQGFHFLFKPEAS